MRRDYPCNNKFKRAADKANVCPHCGAVMVCVECKGEDDE